MTIVGKSLREHFEVVNHKEAIKCVETLATGSEPITPFHVRQVHRIVLTRIDDENTGQYRTVQVRIAGSDHQTPESWEVPSAMDEWDAWL